MIISISGVSCTGKTTTIGLLQEAGYPVITPSASRVASGVKFPTSQAKDRFIFEEGHRQLLEAQQIAESTGKPVFLDRSQFDNWTFRLVYGGDLSYEDRLIADVKQIGFLWILDPGDVPFQDDGVRPADLQKRAVWHDVMAREAGVQRLHWEILRGDPKQRLRYILQRL